MIIVTLQYGHHRSDRAVLNLKAMVIIVTLQYDHHKSDRDVLNFEGLDDYSYNMTTTKVTALY